MTGITTENNIITFGSWNSTGSNSNKCNWLLDTLAEFNVNYLGLQEHFHIGNKEKFQDFSVYSKPAGENTNIG